ncbi:ZYRO0E05786p [Zygosaccharomyces rouxii]|uniref:ZYRO0E05786p n=1 Tax=Zygosaccharomyces rouxii (strain ATCC 2623 / CBS 732 / NBRC 1130 / NCYC 568 / NRRL Y-229) TaxID=559307 RepID=C5E4G5_ZYGRC|nr:uncharacterized protein ZYRO0E05786g [Zygosaccharomyces rouxii]KAH9198216.1 hypothetical protein LQ764DRAFT_155243 [Zygosaccharomyces rouxii]CAR30926.1 ZYRO0E05786p [Zygosaccharomyces rouxii]
MTVPKPAEFFKTIRSVRDTTGPVYQLIKNQGEGNYYKLDESKMDQVTEYLCKIIARDYGDNYNSIPPHGRWQHLNAGGHLRVEQLIDQWRAAKTDEVEISRRLIDLLVVSVLVDAGAGNLWKYIVGESESYSRSEGLAVASYYLFVDGEFSSDSNTKFQVNGQKLKDFTMDQFVKGFQVSDANPLNGAEGRLQLIQKLGDSLLTHPEIFGSDARPGGIVDFLKKEASTGNCIDLNDIWNALMDGFVTIWPQGRATIQGQPLGDSWSLDTKSKTEKKWDDEFLDSLVTFHKLTQWLCYSLLVPLEKFGHKFQVSNKELQTGLPEYRNGGLFYDFGVIALKPEHLKRGLALSDKLGVKEPIPTFTAEDGAIVEWRCLTIGLLDELHALVNKRLNTNLALPQVIEAGSWKAGREIAAEKRPLTKGPPIELQSDGTVF